MKIEGPAAKDGTMFIPAILVSKSLKIASGIVFELDTGASRSVICDMDAKRLQIDYSKLPKGKPAYGIGGKCDTYVIRDAILLFVSGEWLLSRKISISVLKHDVTKVQDPDLKRAIETLPSLLGRDVIGTNFDLTCDGKNVTLNI